MPHRSPLVSGRSAHLLAHIYPSQRKANSDTAPQFYAICGNSDCPVHHSGTMRTSAVIAAGLLTATLSGCGEKTAAPIEKSVPEANIYVVASQSFCAATGIDDAFTGDGHVVFFLAFRNSGGADGTIDATPVRHYDDGEDNASAMDMVSVDVPAGQTTKVHTTAMTYKAHSHGIVDCGVEVVGQDEVPIAVR